MIITSRWESKPHWTKANRNKTFTAFIADESNLQFCQITGSTEAEANALVAYVCSLHSQHLEKRQKEA